MMMTFLIALVSDPVSAENIQLVDRIQFQGNIKASEDLSAVGQIGQYMIIGSDEGTGGKKNKNIVQVLVQQEENRYQVIDEIFLFKGDTGSGKEMDIEGIATENNQKPGDAGKITCLGEIGTPEGGKAEGLLVLNETDQSNYEVIIIFDGVPDGMPVRYRVSKLPLQDPRFRGDDELK